MEYFSFFIEHQSTINASKHSAIPNKQSNESRFFELSYWEGFPIVTKAATWPTYSQTTAAL